MSNTLALYHANAKGTGSAARITLHPAKEDRDGSIEFRLAPQKSVGDRAAGVLPSFDWDDGVGFDLDFGDLSQMVQVFRGEVERINEGRGLYHESVKCKTVIRFGHEIEPLLGYALEVVQKTKADGTERTVRFFIHPSEASGLSCAFEYSVPLIAFGVPVTPFSLQFAPPLLTGRRHIW